MISIAGWTITANHDQHLTAKRDRVTVADHSTAGLPDAQFAALVGEVEALTSQYPYTGKDRVLLTVEPDDDKFQHEYDDNGRLTGVEEGNTEMLRARIRINENAFGDLDAGNGSMPVSRHVPQWVYAVAHEYGHAIGWAYGAVRVSLETMVADEGMSPYGRRGFAEAWAEAYAEWVLTRGETRNLAARAYARDFGWIRPTTKISPLPLT